MRIEHYEMKPFLNQTSDVKIMTEASRTSSKDIFHFKPFSFIVK